MTHPMPSCWLGGEYSGAGWLFSRLAQLAEHVSGGIILVRRKEKRLEDEAERALPGPLDVSFPRGKRPE